MYKIMPMPNLTFPSIDIYIYLHEGGRRCVYPQHMKTIHEYIPKVQKPFMNICRKYEILSIHYSVIVDPFIYFNYFIGNSTYDNRDSSAYKIIICAILDKIPK